MVAIKAHQADKFLKSIDPEIKALLFYGPDVGLVSERARGAAKALSARDGENGEIIRLHDEEISENPDRLAIELNTIPMFGGQKVVHATMGRRMVAPLLGALDEPGKLESFLVVEAGNMKPTDKIRKLFEGEASTAAIACFGDGERDLKGLATAVLGERSISISSDVLEYLIARLGGDRALSRQEIEKLALYADGQADVSIEDVDAVVGDASEQALDKVAFAAALGQSGRALREFDRSVAAGLSPQAVALAVQRHFLRLHRIQMAFADKGTLKAAFRMARPPVHFKHEGSFTQQCRNWPVARLARALMLIQAAIRRTRMMPQTERVVSERLLIELTRMVPTSGPTSGR